MSALITLEQLNEALADRLEDLLPDLIGGRQVRGEWLAESTRDGGLGDSLSVNLRGSKRGKWYHHAAGVGGDTLGLINYVRFGNRDMKRAYGWARDFLGGKIPAETDKERELRRQRKEAAQRQGKREERERAGRARYHFLFDDKVVKNWRETPAWHYLNNRLEHRFRSLGHLPGCIRFHPALHNSQLGCALPAMIAAIVDDSGEQTSLHRTWLIQRGPSEKDWDRIRPQDASTTTDGRELKGKKALGSYLGGTIRAWAGRRVNLDTGEIKLGEQWPRLAQGSSIMLAEGIETAYSLALAMPERRIVTTVSIDGFAAVRLPGCFTNVTIAADRDPGNTSTTAAIERAKEAHALAGRHVTVVYPPEGIDDWNTALKQTAGRAA